ncbi:hypothetical protein Y032_0029g1952 [Ancylostoma ceylanicum]|uniref:Uncharacterized protein n=1 Tax=Ancylostoma ceylanicum TaxID=53326 RepID=A0A016URS6_9BILA|nr:hypothetical protein Y032_0029g1952 [Ancylostoma ceylanicum]
MRQGVFDEGVLFERDEGEGNEVSSPQVIDLPPISTYLPEEHIERPALRSLLHNSQAMGSLEKLIRSVVRFETIL